MVAFFRPIMVSVALIVIACVVPCILTFANVILMARYLDSSATRGHFIAKIMILLGLLLAECTILLLPMDVGNAAGVVGCGFWNDNCGGLNLALVWEIVYMCILGAVVVVFPFFIYFYEADDEGMSADEAAQGEEATCMTKFCYMKNFKRSLGSAICYTLITCAIAAIVIALMYVYLAYTSIPYRLTTVDIASVAFQPVGTRVSLTCPQGATNCLQPCGDDQGCTWNVQYIEMTVSFTVYVAALMSFLGWFMFTAYVGIGLVALPMDLIQSFKQRPKVLSLSEARQQRRQLMNRSQELLNVGDGMASRMIDFNDDVKSKKQRRKQGKLDAQEMNRFRVLVDMLEADLEKFQLCDPQNYREHYNPLWPWFKLVCGILSIFITLAWLVHIVIFMLFSPPFYAFLNYFLMWFDGFFPLFGTIAVAVFGMYLLLCVAKGNIKFGTRFFLIKVHPMEPHKTLLNSFVFNVALILMCCLPCVQFLTNAFSTYARLTDASILFGTQFKYLRFFKFFWQYNVFLFGILAFALLTAIYLAIWPSDRDHLNKVMMAIKAKKGAEMRNFEKALDRTGGSLSAVQESKKGKKKG